MPFLGICFAIMICSVSWAGVLHVPGDFSSLAEAIAAAGPGDEIRIAPGRYVGEFSLTKPVRLVGSGADRTFLATLAAQPVISVSECVVEIVGISVSKGIGWLGDDGIWLQSGRLVLSDCVVHVHGGTGIQVDAGELVLNRSAIIGCRIGVVLSYAEGTLVALETRFEENKNQAVQIHEGQAKLENCTFIGNETGLDVSGGEVLVRECIFQGNKLALEHTGGTISGGGNFFRENAQDIWGNVPASFRAPREKPTQGLVHFPSPEYINLAEAVEAVAPGGTLVLESGSKVDARLTVDKEITIRCVGDEPATIFAGWNTPGRGPVLTLLSGAVVHLVNIVIEHEFYDPVVAVFGDAVLRAEGCTFATRGRMLDEGMVVLRDESKAYFIGCMFTHDGEGEVVLLSLHDRAEARVENSMFEGYEVFGIEAQDESWVTGENNRFLGLGAALGGNVDPSVRVRLRVAEAMEIIWPNEKHANLQDAVDALLPGGTLLITEGTHKASAVLDKDIVIMGRSTSLTVLTPSAPDAPVFSVLPGTNVEIRKLTISANSRGILVSGGSEVKLSDCELGTKKIGSWALRLTGDAQAIAEDCKFMNPRAEISLVDASSLRLYGSRCETSEGYTIDAKTAGSVRIERSHFTGAWLHLNAEGGGHIEDCTFIDARRALQLNTGSFRVVGCRFIGGEAGVWLWGAEQAIVEDCQFQDLEVAIRSTQGNSLEVRRCSISGIKGYGIEIEHPTVLVVEDSVITDCAHGLLLRGSRAQIERTQVIRGRGSGIVVANGELIVNDSVVERNKCYGIYIYQHDPRPALLSGMGNVVRNNGFDFFPYDLVVPEGFMEMPPPLKPAPLIKLPSPDYPSLKEAIRNLLPGGTVILGPGSYEGGLYIDRHVAIRAEEGARPVIVTPLHEEQREIPPGEKLFPHANPPSIVVTGAGCLQMEGIDVLGWPVGIEVTNAGKAELVDVHVSKARVGFYLADQAQIIAERCKIEAEWNGVRAAHSSRFELRDSSILGPDRLEKNGTTGVILHDQAEGILIHAHVAGFFVGILMIDRASLSMNNSVVEGNRLGAAVYSSNCFPAYIDIGPFLGAVTGFGNRFRHNQTDFCPAFPGVPWPTEFLEK